MAVEKIDLSKAEAAFYRAAAVTQSVHNTKADEATKLQATAMNNYFSCMYQIMSLQTKALNDMMDRLDRIEALTNKHGMITTLR